MDKVTKRIVTASIWAASSDLTPVALPREGLITEVGIRAAITTGALTATAVADGMRRVLQNIKISGDGDRPYLGMSGEQMSRVLAFMNECDFGCALQDSLLPEVGDTTLPNISFVFHPGSNPKDPFDMSAIIPARALATLQIALTTTAATIIDAAGTADITTASRFYYWINQVMGVKVPAGIMTPMGSTFIQDLAATYSDHSFKIDVPAGAWLRRIVFLIQDDTANPERIDTEVTSVRLELPKAPVHQIEIPIQDLKVMTAKRYGFTGSTMLAALGAVTTRPGWEVEKVLPKGLFILDLRDYFHPIWGANLTGYQTGDVKLGLTISVATGEAIIYWDQLQPVEAQYVGK